MYGNLSDADTYFTTRRVGGTQWLAYDDNGRTAALNEAYDRINTLHFDKPGAVDGIAFPQEDELTVPQDIEYAAYEIAFMLLSGVNTDARIDGAGFTEVQMGPIQVVRSTPPEHIVAGVHSPRAWTYLRPYLADPTKLKVTVV